MPNDSLIESARQQLEYAHSAPSGRSAETTIFVLAGRVRVTWGEDLTWAGGTGDLIVVPGAPHRLHADEDSAVLLTVAKTG
jgi:quercetin dioxygenase-like cupin family protein